MTSAQFHSSRAIDLSGIVAAAKAPPVPAGASFVAEADERSFEALMQLSLRHPLVLELWSPRANAEALSQDLISLANAAGGRYLLVRVNVDAAPGIAQALAIQAVPSVFGVIGGQLAPLFQGTTTKPEAEAIIEQLLAAAAANGLVGRADPVAGGAGEDPDQVDPRYAEADAALERGDFAAARIEFEKILAATPNDSDAIAGRAQAGLLARVAVLEPNVTLRAAAAAPEDAAAQLAAADVELMAGQADAAFARLIGLVRETSGPVRDEVKARLLELFETLGNADPAVLKGRRDLMSALF